MKHTTAHHHRRLAMDRYSLLRLLCISVQVGLFILGWELMQEKIKLYAQTSLLLFLIYTILLSWLHQTYGSLRIGSSVRLLHLFTGQILTLLMSDGLIFLISTLSIRMLPNIPVFLAIFACQIVFSFFWCRWANHLYQLLTPPRHTIIIYQSQEDLDTFQQIVNTSTKYQVTATYHSAEYEKQPEKLLSALQGVETVFVGSVSPELRNHLLRFGLEHQTIINFRPTMEDVLVATTQRRFMTNIPIFKAGLTIPALPLRMMKRSIDLFASGLLLLLTSPIMAVVAILIRHEDRGPALFRQDRLTQGGKVFQILKFRSMRIDAEKDGVARLAAQNDDRITKIGRFIRATRLDELPQLWNIFKGDMSLVGPRPERPEIAAQYMEVLPQFNARLMVKAGLTGYAQVNGKYNTTPADKLQMDLMYIADMSLALDIRLILQTILIMMQKESTEGIQEGTTTALKDDPS